ncbi:hypothetical protein ACFQBQ_05375 [Granulicella cerasi]|uniref:Uncharacterized protein n=1 Tax=Granulicella cerasi TaxID=741063 RepID=A0ABW1Z6Q2_9BACT|nr:hypothetical protein [Granulicella cerasi]
MEGIRGTVFGGQQPVTGAKVYVYQVGTSGAGGASVSVLTNGSNNYVTSGPDGYFTLTNLYSCTSGSSVYVYIVGGSSDSVNTNTGIGLLGALGVCPSSGSFASQVPFLYVNEVSTVLTAYALAGYATDATHISSSGSTLAQKGVANAIANVANLMNIGTGLPYTTAASTTSSVVPAPMIYTLANILAACINTSTVASTNCATLFSTATSTGTTGGTVPTDTATAAINIAHHPGVNQTKLFNLIPATAPFSGALTVVPNDYTIGVKYSNVPAALDLAVDASGNTWAVTASSLYAVTPQGSSLTGSPFTGNGMQTNRHLAIDKSGNVWVGSQTTLLGAATGTYLSKFSSVGAALTNTSNSTAAGIGGMAIDGAGNIWWAGSVLGRYNPTANTFLTSAAGLLSGPITVAVDGAGYGNAANTTTVGLTGDGYTTWNTSVANVSTFKTNSNLYTVTAEAIDSAGNAWFSDSFSNAAVKITRTGITSTATFTGTPYTGGGISAPTAINLDGDANVWLTNNTNTLSELSAAGTVISETALPTGVTGSLGYSGVSSSSSYFATPVAVATDGSGNVWVANSAGSYGLTMLLGAGAPEVTPIAAGLPTTFGTTAASSLATRP